VPAVFALLESLSLARITDPMGISGYISPCKSATDLVIASGDPGFAGSGLRVSSTIRLHRMLTAANAIIRRHLGRLTPDLIAEVDKRLVLLFDLR